LGKCSLSWMTLLLLVLASEFITQNIRPQNRPNRWWLYRETSGAPESQIPPDLRLPLPAIF
jgi:hypothetical protein